MNPATARPTDRCVRPLSIPSRIFPAHPHLHILAASGLSDKQGRFHLLPSASAEALEALTELFRNRFLQALVTHKLLTAKKAMELLGWKHSGFNLDAGEAPVAGSDVDGRRRLAEYLLRAPFSLQKTTWVKETATVLYRSGHHCPEEIEFFLRLHGLWERLIAIPPPPDPPFDVESFEPIRVPPEWCRWIPDHPDPDSFALSLPPWSAARNRQQPVSETDTGSEPWIAQELPLDDERRLILDADPAPQDENPVFVHH